ncbi:MAG: proline--tRNA ligase [Patescibacteria group bacterium]
MRQSKLFFKTQKEYPKDEISLNARLLIRANFIDKLMAGVYSFLPLGWRVHKKIENIIREEINAIAGQEVFLPALQPKTIWEKTGRWDKMEPPLFKFQDQHEKDLALGSTHEEVITDLVGRFVNSYRDLPLYLYQIQNKFRNEIRSTGGLLRVREFLMKDLYSFHTSSEDLDIYYQKVIGAYKKIFNRCGFDAKIAEASSGSIGGDVSNEFMMLCDTGEDKIFYCAKCDWAINEEKLDKKTLEKCPTRLPDGRECGGKILNGQAIENGHVFKLKTKYSEKLGAYFIDKDGNRKPIIMGCYGIGLGRLMASAVEAHNDAFGIIWPEEIAPFDIHLLEIGKTTKPLRIFTEKIYQELEKASLEVLYDDREGVFAGEKFTDADLIGIPWRLVVSEKTHIAKKVELKRRGQEKTEILNLEEAIKKIKLKL